MLLKTADDKSGDIQALEVLLGRPDVDARQRRAIQDEIWAIRLGAKAESDAAYQLDFDLRDSKNWAVIHDLRIDVDGLTAQIDHVVISQMLEVFVCESKSYTGGVKVNEHGEWLTFRDRRPIGIPSPVEQNRRHIKVLEQVIKLGYVKLPRRIVTLKPTYKNIVLVSVSGLINRPKQKLPDLDLVVKVDQFRTYLLNRDFPDRQMLKLVGSDTLEAFGRQLVALHRPADVDWAAKFGVATAAPSASVEATPARRRWLVKYDGPCSNCGAVLTKGTEAIWRQRERRMLCLDCGAE
jgi:Nuclease-related domain